MNALLRHLRKNIIGGLLAIIPIMLSILVVRLLYLGIDQRVMKELAPVLRVNYPGLGFLLTLLALYGLGIITNNVAGKQLWAWGERLVARIPLVKTTYQVGKQLASTLALPEKQIFQRAVLVEYLTSGMWTLGFVTGSLTHAASGKMLLKVYIPTPPNPTSGTMVLVAPERVRDPGWSIEEALKSVISAGIIGPDILKGEPLEGLIDPTQR